MDKKTRKAYILSFIIQVIVTGGLMFLFYYFADKSLLLTATLKALSFGLFISTVNIITNHWLTKKYKT